MKKIIILLALLSGCSTFGRPPVFEYIVIKKSTIANPSFSIHVTGNYNYSNDWLHEEIENVLMSNKLSVFALSTSNTTKQTTTTGSIGVGFLKDSVEVKSKTDEPVDLTQIKASYLFIANYDLSTFKIILVKTQEVVAKGTFIGMYSEAIKSNVSVILNEMGIAK